MPFLSDVKLPQENDKRFGGMSMRHPLCAGACAPEGKVEENVRSHYGRLARTIETNDFFIIGAEELPSFPIDFLSRSSVPRCDRRG